MKQSDNPYTPGAGLSPPILAGRQAEISQFELMIERLLVGKYERSLICSGLRGVGKTVLLREFNFKAAESGWSTSGVHEVGSQADFRISFGRMASRVLWSMSLKKRAVEKVTRVLGVVRAFAELGAGPIKLKLEIDPTHGIADSGDPEMDLADLLQEIGEVAQATGSGALFLIDEMQNLDELSLAAISMAFHRISQTGLPVAMVGAGLPTLSVKLFQAKPYADRLFIHKKLGQLPKQDAGIALTAPAGIYDVTFTDNAVDFIVRESRGFPYFIQEYGRVTWDEAQESPISEKDVIAVQRIVDENLAEHFFWPRFELATDGEQTYLMAMASLGEGPYPTADVAAAASLKSAPHASPLRQRLMEKELIWSPRRGQIAFTVPGFDSFVRNQFAIRPVASVCAITDAASSRAATVTVWPVSNCNGPILGKIALSVVSPSDP